MSCAKCNTKIQRDATKVNCGCCKNLYHSSCVSLTDSDIEYLKNEKKVWMCIVCLDKQKSNRNHDNCPATPSKESNTTIIEKVYLEIQEIKAENKKNNEYVSKRLDVLQLALEKIEQLASENTKLHNRLSVNETKIDYLEQMLEQNAVEIHGLPVNVNENVESEVMNMLNKGIDCKIQTSDIDVCYRKHNKSNQSSSRLPLIYVKFTRRNTKERVLAAKKKIINSYLDMTTSSVNNKIYINESLTFTKRKLLHEAKLVKLELNFKYIWTRNGNIFLRRFDGSELIKVNTINDLDLIKDKFKN